MGFYHGAGGGGGGAVPSDVRGEEVCSRHSSCEADEQSRATGCGVGGAKGGGRGECESAKHGPGTVPGNRVTGAEAHTASCKAKEEGEVHRALPPRQYGSPRRGILRAQSECCTWGGWADMSGLRAAP